MTRWLFVASPAGDWHWTRETTTGKERIFACGRTFRTRRECLEDAIVNHGLRAQDCWEVIGRESAEIRVLTAGAACEIPESADH